MQQGIQERVRRAIDERGFAVVERWLQAEQLAALADAMRAHEQRGAPMSADILYTHAPPPPATGEPRGMGRLMDPRRIHA